MTKRTILACLILFAGLGIFVLASHTQASTSPTFAISVPGVSGTSFATGETWTVSVTGPANTTFSICAIDNLGDNTCTPWSTTNANGFWSGTGTFAASSAGNWQEWVSFPSDNNLQSSKVSFTVAGPQPGVCSSVPNQCQVGTWAGVGYQGSPEPAEVLVNGVGEYVYWGCAGTTGPIADCYAVSTPSGSSDGSTSGSTTPPPPATNLNPPLPTSPPFAVAATYTNGSTVTDPSNPYPFAFPPVAGCASNAYGYGGVCGTLTEYDQQLLDYWMSHISQYNLNIPSELSGAAGLFIPATSPAAFLQMIDSPNIETGPLAGYCSQVGAAAGFPGYVATPGCQNSTSMTQAEAPVDSQWTYWLNELPPAIWTACTTSPTTPGCPGAPLQSSGPPQNYTSSTASTGPNSTSQTYSESSAASISTINGGVNSSANQNNQELSSISTQANTVATAPPLPTGAGSTNPAANTTTGSASGDSDACTASAAATIASATGVLESADAILSSNDVSPATIASVQGLIDSVTQVISALATCMSSGSSSGSAPATGTSTIPPPTVSATSGSAPSQSQTGTPASSSTSSNANAPIGNLGSYRYLKVNTTENAWVAWREIQVYNTSGVELTNPNTNVTSSAVYDGTWQSPAIPPEVPQNAVDGNPNTIWNAGETNPSCDAGTYGPSCPTASRSAWIQLDLGSSQPIGSIRLLNNGTSNTETVQVYGSTDGTNYTLITTFNPPMQDEEWLDDPAPTASSLPTPSISFAANGTSSVTVTMGELVTFTWDAQNVTGLTTSVTAVPNPAVPSNSAESNQICTESGFPQSEIEGWEDSSPFQLYGGTGSGYEDITSYPPYPSCWPTYTWTVTLTGKQEYSNATVSATVTLNFLPNATNNFEISADDPAPGVVVIPSPGQAPGAVVSPETGVSNGSVQVGAIITYPSYPTISIDPTSIPTGVTVTLGAVTRTVSNTQYSCLVPNQPLLAVPTLTSSQLCYPAGETAPLTISAGKNTIPGYHSFRIVVTDASGAQDFYDYLFEVAPASQ